MTIIPSVWCEVNRISSMIRGKAPERQKKFQILYLADKRVE